MVCTPVRIDDMLMPGDNWIDISRTAIRKSKAAIIDISDSSSNVMLELGLIDVQFCYGEQTMHKHLDCCFQDGSSDID